MAEEGAEGTEAVDRLDESLMSPSSGNMPGEAWPLST